MNGHRMKASDAPTSRMISISSARDVTASRIVFTMMKSTVSPTRTRTTIPAVRMTVVTVMTRSTSCCDLLDPVDPRRRLEQRDDRREVACGSTR